MFGEPALGWALLAVAAHLPIGDRFLVEQRDNAMDEPA